jgi:predicted metal-dependent peptidase
VRAAAEKNRGSVPDSLVRWADVELAPPKIPWREKLARVVRGAVAFKSGATDLSWNRPSRRQAGVGFGVGRPVVPATHAPVPKVKVLIDVSGSMSEGALQIVASEVDGVLAATGANVTVATVDATLQGIRECRTIQEAVGLFKGGGGTVLIHGWKALLERKPVPDVLIICTDGFIGGPGDGYPEDEPKSKCIWVVVEGTPDSRPCPWGDVIHVSRDDVREVG